MLAGVSVQVNPDGVTVLVRVTAPAKPLTGMTVIVELANLPGSTLTIVGLANIWKSTTWTVITVVVCESEPLLPVTVTV